MKKRQKKSRIIIGSGIAISLLGFLLSIVGLSKTISDLDDEVISRTPDAILASVGVDDGTNISLPVAYFDQRADKCVNLYDNKEKEALRARQFEWASCGYDYGRIEQGMVEYELGENYLPIGIGGGLISNRGLSNMERWFNNVEGSSKGYSGFVDLTYSADENAELSFSNNEFYPLDEVDFSKSDEVNRDGHNHLFTMSLAIPFAVTASGDEHFEIAADDDTFVFVGEKLAIDMGGIHDVTRGQITINEDGEVYAAIGNQDFAYSGIRLGKGQETTLRIFHADRNAIDSSFSLKLQKISINILPTQVANVDSSSVQAIQNPMDPNDPAFVAPLGETSIFKPSNAKGYTIMATIFGVIMVMCSLFVMMLVRAFMRTKIRR